MSKKLFFFCLFLLIPLLCTAAQTKKKNAPEKIISGTVIGVKTCTNVLFQDDNKKLYSIFLVGLKGIRETDPMFEVCRQQLSDKVANKHVKVKVLRSPADGIIIGRLQAGKSDIAQKMLEEGWGVFDTECTLFPAYKRAGENAEKRHRGYYAPEEKKKEMILAAVPIPYNKDFVLRIDKKGVTHNFKCTECDFKECQLSFVPTKKQCESCGGYSYWVEKYRPEHERRIANHLPPLIHGEKLIEDRVEEHVRMRVDEMEGITWYSSDRVKISGGEYECTYHQGNSFYIVEPYFGIVQKNGRILFRMRTKYLDLRDKNYDADWIFYDRVQLLGVDNKSRLNITPGPEKESSVEKYGLEEWSDNYIDAEEFVELMKSKEIRVKFYGKYTCEFSLTTEQYQMFEEILFKYKSLIKRM